MKKQIFILVLVFFTLSIGSVLGQSATHTSAPEAAPSCANDALHPIAGKAYDYTVTSAPSTGALYHWYATTDATFMTGGVLNNATALGSPDVIPTTAAVYNSATNSTGTLNMSWGTDILAAAMSSAASPVPTFVVVYSTGTSCSDNLKVFQVEPINAFMVDIKNVKHDTKAPLAYGAAESQCYGVIQSASWASDKMTYDYGTNVLYFEVVASNFTGTWTPTFTLGALQTGQTATIEWDYDTSFGSPNTVTSGTASGTPVTTLVTDTSNGVSIFVRVTVSNNTWEGTTDDNVTLSVTGTNSAGLSDVLATTCATATAADNSATQTLNMRPTINESTDLGTFEQP